ncbi:MAG: hypothetical protein HYY31_01290 [Chloroflexi bacterium]|nr:hypothetical protein [Chloroflexota bacterium]
MKRIFFDVDQTLLYSSGNGWSLRPGVHEVFSQLKARGFDIYIWSATGKPHCERLVDTYGLGDYVTECFDKDGNLSLKPDLIVDDDWFLVEKYSGIQVTAYRQPDPEDQELFRVLATLEAQSNLV